MFVLLLGTLTFAVTNIAGCGVLAAGTSYYLTADIPNAVGNCFTTGGAGTTLDCGGHIVDGVDAAIGYWSSTDNNYVYNCSFTDWTYGVYVGNANTNTTIANSNFSSNPTADIYLNTALVFLNNSKINSQVIGITEGGIAGTLKLYITNTTIINGTGNAINLVDNGVGLVLNNMTINYSKVFITSGATIDVNITDIANTNAVLLKAVSELTGTRLFFNVSDGTTIYNNQYTNLTSTATASTWIFSSTNGTSYWNKTYIRSPTSGYEIIATLLPSSTPINNVNFIVQTGAYTPLPNAVVTVYAPALGYTLLVDTKITDGSGLATVNGLSTTTNYLVVTSATGYTTLSKYIYPASANYYINLAQAASIGFDYPYIDITCNWNIDTLSIPNTTTNFNLNIIPLNFSIINGTSTPPTLDYCGWYVYNGTSLFNASNPTINVTNATGCYMNVTISPYDVGNITIRGFFKVSNSSSVYNCSKFFYVYYIPQFNQSMTSLITRLSGNGGGFGGSVMSFFAIMAAMLCGAYVGRMNGILGAGTFILVICAFYGVGLLQIGFITSLIIVSLLIVLWKYVW